MTDNMSPKTSAGFMTRWLFGGSRKVLKLKMLPTSWLPWVVGGRVVGTPPTRSI